MSRGAGAPRKRGCDRGELPPAATLNLWAWRERAKSRPTRAKEQGPRAAGMRLGRVGAAADALRVALRCPSKEAPARAEA